MKINKLFYTAPILIGAIFLSLIASSKLNNYTSVNRAGDVVGPGVTTKRDRSGCHSGTPNAQDNTKRIFTFGTGTTSYEPGKEYTIKYKAIATGPVGFSCTVLRNDSNTMVGVLTASDTNETKVFCHTASGRYYMNHRVGATTDGVKEYTFKWTAPALGTGDITFYFASVSSNNDDGSTDDTVYTNTYVITEKLKSDGIENLQTFYASVYPNPASDILNVNFFNHSTSLITVMLISYDGKESLNLLSANLENGMQALNFNISGKVKPGVYLLKISSAHSNCIQKILVQ